MNTFISIYPYFAHSLEISSDSDPSNITHVSCSIKRLLNSGIKLSEALLMNFLHFKLYSIFKVNPHPNDIDSPGKS